MQDIRRTILVHYHEIGLKGRNRSVFEKKLESNIRTLSGDYPLKSIARISGRIVVELLEGTTTDQALEYCIFLARIPGIAKTSSGVRCDAELDEISKAALMLAHEADDFHTFKVNARRAHTDFPTCSMDINKIVGQVLCDELPEKKVRMKGPDLEIGIEVVQSKAYVYGQTIKGVGGLPVGTSGKMVCLLSSGIDSPVALWKMAKRGGLCYGIHFSGRPETTDESEYLVKDIAEELSSTGCIQKVYVVPFGEYQRRIALHCDPSLRIILYRRLMVKVATALARRIGAEALVTGESLGQVASQTLPNLNCTNSATDMMILRPLIGEDKQDIIYDSQSIGTFETSSQDAPDCCTLFMPRNPETHGNLARIIEEESKFPEDEWVEQIMEQIEISWSASA